MLNRPTHIAAQMFSAAAMILGSALLHAHEYNIGSFTIIHPWTITAEAGAEQADLFMDIVDIQEDDALVAAHTDLAESVEIIPPASARSGELAIPFMAGDELKLSTRNGFLRLHRVNTPLMTGSQYPITLVFDKAGGIEVDFIIEPD